MSIDGEQRRRPSLPQLIFSDGTPKKAGLAALLIGTLLITINHGDTILNGLAPAIWKIILTYCVPYCVATWGAVTGKIAQWNRYTNSDSLQTKGTHL